LSTHLRLGLPSGLFPSSFPINILYVFLFSPFLLHAMPISSSIDRVHKSSHQIFVDRVCKMQLVRYHHVLFRKATLTNIFIRTLVNTVLSPDSYQMDNHTTFIERKKAGAWTWPLACSQYLS
jgi:hypothetical protein